MCDARSRRLSISIKTPESLTQTIDQPLSMEPVIMAKSAAFGALHLGIAFSVSYALSGSVAVAGAITLVEPLVNTVAHYWFDRWWPQREAARLKLQHFFAKRLALRAAPSRI
jgi:uncharacterized membrane protein